MVEGVEDGRKEWLMSSDEEEGKGERAIKENPGGNLINQRILVKKEDGK